MPASSPTVLSTVFTSNPDAAAHLRACTVYVQPMSHCAPRFAICAVTLPERFWYLEPGHRSFLNTYTNYLRHSQQRMFIPTSAHAWSGPCWTCMACKSMLLPLPISPSPEVHALQHLAPVLGIHTARPRRDGQTRTPAGMWSIHSSRACLHSNTPPPATLPHGPTYCLMKCLMYCFGCCMCSAKRAASVPVPLPVALPLHECTSVRAVMPEARLLYLQRMATGCG